ncbi:MAG: biopolymer transporter ExbD [Deltaproteobacteria bacterium]|nr:MAG: biopolymer transporter ExbD [Deltaproteobacteria bacterium]
MKTPFAKDDAGDIVPVINVTPLVDIVLVLLIIFMVVLPSMQDEGLPIEMFKVEDADEFSSDGPEPIVITMTEDARILVGDTDVQPDRLPAALTRAVDRAPGARILLRADARLPYRTVRETFRIVQDAGFRGVHLAVGVARKWSETPKEGT